MSEFLHPDLGTIKGIRTGAVLSFRGLKYASLENGFSDPLLFSTEVGDVVEGRFHGPTTVTTPMGCDMELSLIQKNLPHEPFQMSATECLNLNLSMPSERSKPLPVFVFLHGGGFMIGSNAWPQYDLTRIVALSEELGQPVIGIQINYRLGAHGFLYSEDLGKVGIKPNRGLLDQQAALRWVQKNIAGFGGDPSQVTLVGESAGGASATLHLQSSEPLFTQVVAMAGNSLMLQPIPLETAEGAYREVLSLLKINPDSPPQDQARSILEVSPSVWLQTITPNMPMLPVVAGDIVQRRLTYSEWTQPQSEVQLPGLAWCRRIMIGDCQFDGSIFAYMIGHKKANISRGFRTSLSSTLDEDPSIVEAICTGYNITDDIDDDTAMFNVLKFFTDLLFYVSAITIARGWPGPAYVYHFNEPNPWEGPWKGEATHILDVAFLFQNFNEMLESKQQVSARTLATDFIKFVSGEEPYEKYEASAGGARVYGTPTSGQPEFVFGTEPENYLRRKNLWDIASKVNFDKLHQAFHDFVSS